MTADLDIRANRRSRKWTATELAGRLLWDLMSGPLFRWSPRPFWGWRRLVLRLFGARVARGAHVHPTARITIPWNLDLGEDCAVGDRAILYALGPIAIGQRATISQYAHLCAGSHDFRDGRMTLLKPPISIGDDAWICADAFIGPGVTIGPRAVVGARAVAMRDIPPGAVVAGNPARIVSRR